MKIKDLKRKALGVTLASVMALSVIPVFGDNITTSGGTANVPVKLVVESPTFSVTVPTSIDFTIQANGTVVAPTNLRLTNNSIGPVKVTNVEVAGIENGFIVEAFNTDYSNTAVNTKKMGLKLNNTETVTVANSENYGEQNLSLLDTNWPSMAASNDANNEDELPLTVEGNFPTQTTSMESTQIASVVFTVAWDQ